MLVIIFNLHSYNVTLPGPHSHRPLTKLTMHFVSVSSIYIQGTALKIEINIYFAINNIISSVHVPTNEGLGKLFFH